MAYSKYPRQFGAWLAICGGLLLLTGCDKNFFQVPALVSGDQGGERLPGAVITNDLLTDDLEGAMLFYGGLFAWNFEPLEKGPGYVAQYDGKNVAVFFENSVPEAAGSGNRALWLPGISVEDVSASARMAESAGGEVQRPAFDLPDRGRMAVLRDPDGAIFALVHSPAGDPPMEDRFWSGNVILARTPVELAGYYRKALGYAPTENEGRLVGIGLFKDGERRATVDETYFANVPAVWVPVLAVRSVEEMVRIVEYLEGAVLYQTAPDDRGPEMALIQDPQGALFAVWEEE